MCKLSLIKGCNLHPMGFTADGIYFELNPVNINTIKITRHGSGIPDNLRAICYRLIVCGRMRRALAWRISTVSVSKKHEL
jgi:hypothetical protein